MSDRRDPVADRGSVDGVRMILRYNWPLYLAGLAIALTGAIVATRPSVPTLLRAAGAASAAVAGWLAAASLGASWWIYDRSELYRWSWLLRAAPPNPRRILVVHAGLDEASDPVARTWPTAAVAAVDVHRGVGRTTTSLRIARRDAHRAAPEPGSLPQDNDLVVAFLAAHELRSRPDRVELMATVHDHLTAGGRLVLVEHVRDLANAAVFGPAVGHFYPVDEWRAVIGAGGMEIVTEERITPFVVLLTATRPA